MEWIIVLTLLLVMVFSWNIYSKDANNKAISRFCAIIIGMLFAVTLSIDNSEIEPTALDAYQGKTTLEITYRDSIPVDSTVVYKEEFKK